MARPRKDLAIDIKARAIEATIAQLAAAPESLSLAAVARRIGCSAPALYAHFRNKDDLLEEARRAAFAELIREKARRYAAPISDPLARLAEGGRAFVAFARDNPALYRLIFAPGHGGAARVEPVEAALAPLVAGLRAAQAAGFARGADPEALARALWCAAHGAIMTALDDRSPGAGETRWEQAFDAVSTIMSLISDTRAEE